jgi:ABC-type transport system involved in multi-copper enzyme maturation permease subunit
MNATILIASRELRDRSRLFLIAAVMAVVPFLAALALRRDRQMGMAAIALVLGVAYTGALALMLGVSTIGRELTEKRLPFLFARPVSPAAIWFGKAVAAFLICLGAFAIIILPTYLLAHAGWTEMWAVRLTGDAVTMSFVGLCVCLFLGGHIASTMLRSRSARVALDFVFLGLALFAIGALLRPILLVGAGDVAIRILIGISGGLLILFGVAPVWQLARGRIDARRNHAALSNALWIGVAVLLVAVAVYTRWVISPPLSSFNGVFLLSQSPTGSSIFVAGAAPNRGSFVASYVIDTATGHRERLDVPSVMAVYFSPDGRTMAWMEDTALLPKPTGPIGADARDILERAHAQKGTGAFRLMVRRLDPGAKTVETPLIVPMPGQAQLSDDGSRIAMMNGKQVDVYEVASGRLIAAVQGFEEIATHELFFAGPDVLRIIEDDYRSTPVALKIHQFDLVQRKLTTVKTPIWRNLYSSRLSSSGDGARLFIVAEGLVLDTRTGEQLLSLPGTPEQRRDDAMLRDGSFAVIRDSKLVHLDAAGHMLGEVPIGIPEAYVIGEVGPTKLLMGTRGGVMIVDLAARKVAVSVDGISGPAQMRMHGALPRYAENATFVGFDRQSHNFVLWDARTGVKRPMPS